MNLNSSSQLSDVTSAFVAEKRQSNVSRSYLKFVQDSLNVLIAATGNPAISSVPSGGIQAAVNADPNPSVTQGRFALYKSFFKWTKQTSIIQREQPNPMATLAPPAVRPVPVEPYSVDEVRPILGGIEDPFHAVPAVLAGFAGLERCELRSLEWTEINHPGIMVVGGGNLMRTVPVLPVLREWLAPFSQFVLEGPIHRGPILALVPPNSFPIAVQVRRLRLAFAINRLAATGNAEQARQESGMSRPTFGKVLRGTKQGAGDLFKLTPSACGRVKWAEEVRRSVARRRIPVGSAESHTGAVARRSQTF